VRWRSGAAFFLAAAGCKGGSAGSATPAPPPSAVPIASARPTVTASASAAEAAPSSTPSDAGPRDAAIAHATRDGGTACALLTGPVAMPFRRNGAITAAGDGADVVFNDGGKPLVIHVAAGARSKADDGNADTGLPACAITATHYYCPDAGGGVHRVQRGGGVDAVVAHATKGTHIEAATIGGSHSVLGYLDRKLTDHGWLSAANVVLDDGPPERIDETGASAIGLARRGEGVLAVMVDGRAALTLVHARALAVEGGALVKGETTAVFAGAPPKADTPQPAVAVTRDGHAFALLALPDESIKFGMIAIRIDDPPRLDEPAALSPYPGSRGRLSIDATQGASRATVARVRADGDAPGVLLELGRLDLDGGAFSSLGVEPTDGDAKDVALDEDAAGDLWLLVTDHTGSFVERRRCR
jgi:hypothetical protein